MLTNSINLKSFKIAKSKKIIKQKLKLILENKKNDLFKSLTTNYVDSYKIKNIKKIVGNNDIRIIGMGGSILGTKAIYDFLKHKIQRKFIFIDNLISSKISNKNKSMTNLIISKSGNTIETISNVNILISKKEKNIFITGKKKNYLNTLAEKLKAEVIEHNNYIGGRYSVLSEVGMLPAQLMGLNPKKFRQLNDLIKNRKFLDKLIINTSSILFFSKRKFNSIILNYDHKSNNLFEWYKQLVAESLGKKSKGILPIISIMPKDNHSLMQFYLDGVKNNFFTFFSCNEKLSDKINKKKLLSSHKYLGSYDINQIILNQQKATEVVFNKKKIPFRSFELINRDEKTLGELFCFFILETILLGKALNVNPFDQPSVELIKKETRKQFF
tara:strand:+ start:227 stop:1381 length:1155 start_codon:yes stop_codon:yes gene_type:complete